MQHFCRGAAGFSLSFVVFLCGFHLFSVCLSLLDAAFTPSLFLLTRVNGITDHVFQPLQKCRRGADQPTSPISSLFHKSEVKGRAWIGVRMRSKLRVIQHSAASAQRSRPPRFDGSTLPLSHHQLHIHSFKWQFLGCTFFTSLSFVSFWCWLSASIYVLTCRTGGNPDGTGGTGGMCGALFSQHLVSTDASCPALNASFCYQCQCFLLQVNFFLNIDGCHSNIERECWNLCTLGLCR